MPGNTPTSVFGKLFEASGIPYPEVLDRLCAFARERFEAQRAYTF
jgi:D-alanine-D-alanine ligase